MQNGIRLAHSVTKDPRAAVREFHAVVSQPDMALVIFFCSNEYDLDVLAAELNGRFAGVQLMGCTTAGEIGPDGYREHSLAGVSLSANLFRATTGEIDHLHMFETSRGHALCQRLLQGLEGRAPYVRTENCFGFLLVDGLSVREAAVARTLQSGLGKVPLVGGSAGDGLNFGATHVYVNGSFRSDSAALALVTTPLPFRVFKTQHFVPTDKRLVITEADTAHRVVKEINGLPAAQEYARLIGVDLRDVDPKRFASSPVVVLIDGNNYVRSIQRVNPDGSITFFCAIEEGLVLRVAQGVNLVKNLEAAFAKIHAEIGPPQLVLGCDCILRRLEIVQDHLEMVVAGIYRRNNTIGFNTYGEQFHGVHVNQTLCGVAIGSAEAGDA
jgi:hypothetical protein